MAEDNELRASLWNGGLYVIRDVFEDGKFVRCEYACMPDISMSDHTIAWKPCAEGVLFKDIEPLAGYDD